MRYAVGIRWADGGGLTAKGRQRREDVRLEAAGLSAEGAKSPEAARILFREQLAAADSPRGRTVHRPGPALLRKADRQAPAAGRPSCDRYGSGSPSCRPGRRRAARACTASTSSTLRRCRS
ncbi:hypothetical protein GCM10010430_51220 [Kitasatospora cystarginea]|uniref:Integrase n=1 Tax=Kitasatospora cystarginea TaxID=58350 RepID=A0ABP5RI13_9ACTN